MHSTKPWAELLNNSALMFSRKLEKAEVTIWGDFLHNLDPQAVQYAFDNWNRNGRYFPKPKDILELVDVYKIETTPTGPHCEPECQARHGKGYDEHDMLWLWKKVSALVKAQKPVVYEALLAELDSKREGGPPEWRRQ